MYEFAGLNDAILIIVKGKATQNNSLYFREFAEEMMSQGVKNFIIDLKECTGMDSTFMGTLTMLALSADSTTSKDHSASCQILNTTEYHKNLLATLGLLNILPIVEEPVTLPSVETSQLPEYDANPKKRLQLILDAHKKLIEVSEQNKLIFEEFVQEMSKEMAEYQPEA